MLTITADGLAQLDGTMPRLTFSRAEVIAHGLVGADGIGLVLATDSGGAARPGCARPQLVEPLSVMRTNSVGGRTSRLIDEPLPTSAPPAGTR